MKRSNEIAVGLTAVGALLMFVLGAIALGRVYQGRRDVIHTARFRAIGGLGAGANVTLRGVKVGRVAAIRVAADDWVEVDLRLHPKLNLPAKPAAVASAATIFGDWRVTIKDLNEEDNEVARLALREADSVGGSVWPGATLPDIGELTSEANRIAGDVAVITKRIGGALDSTAVADVRASLRDLRTTVARLTEIANTQTGNLATLSGNLTRASGNADLASKSFSAVMGRVDSATMNGQLQDFLSSSRQATTALREMTADMQAIVSDVKQHRQSLVRILEASDSLATRMQQGRGTLGLLAGDSALYREATGVVQQLRSLLTDIQANPRRYFRFSVF